MHNFMHVTEMNRDFNFEESYRWIYSSHEQTVVNVAT